MPATTELRAARPVAASRGSPRLVYALGVLLATVFVVRLLIGPTGINGPQTLFSPAVVDFRLPQAIAAALAGAALAVGGLQLQTLLQNPLAGPWVLGVVAGAQLAVATLVVSGAVFGLQLSGVLSPVSLSGITTAAAVGAAVALACALRVARVVDGATLLLCGLVAAVIATGIRGFLLHLVPVQYELLFLSWNQAGFGGVTWLQLRIFAAAVLVGLVLAAAMAKQLNSLLLGADYARSLGVNPVTARRLVLLATVLLSGAATAFCGAVLFIDLAVPHLCRGLLQTADHRRLVPATALLGAIVALSADSVVGLFPGGRVVPVNIITCLMGGPVVLWVLIRGEPTRVVA